MIIGILGKMGSGKTTLASIIKKYGFVEYAMASPVKEIAEIFGYTKNSLYTTQEAKLVPHEKWNVCSREFLQLFGTEIRKVIESTIPLKIKYGLWIDIFLNKYDKNTNYVISDIRFEEEAKMVKDLGGILIKTTRDLDIYSKEKFTSHASEQYIDKINSDFVINNNIVSLIEAENIIKKIIENYI